MSEITSQPCADGPRELSPKQFVDRMCHKIKLDLAQLEAEFADTVLKTGSAELLVRLEEFCIKRFDARAKASVPFGGPMRGIRVDPYYRRVLKVQKGETMREFSRWVGSLDREVRKQLGTRLSSRLDVRMGWWWAAVGKILLENDKGPFVIRARIAGKRGHSATAKQDEPDKRSAQTTWCPGAQSPVCDITGDAGTARRTLADERVAAYRVYRDECKKAGIN